MKLSLLMSVGLKSPLSRIASWLGVLLLDTTPKPIEMIS